MSTDSGSGMDEKLVCTKSYSNSNWSCSSTCGMLWRIWWQRVVVIVIDVLVVVVVCSDIYDDKELQ